MNEKKRYYIFSIVNLLIGIQMLVSTVINIARLGSIQRPYFEVFFLIFGVGFLAVSWFSFKKARKL